MLVSFWHQIIQETFSIICNDGRIINNVVKAIFEQVDATGIEC